MRLVWHLSEFVLVSIAVMGVLAIIKQFSYIPIRRFKLRDIRNHRKWRLSITSMENQMISLSDIQAQQRQLISNFSHELRTPLTISYGYMQSIVRRSHNLTDMQKNALEMATSEMKRTIDLLQKSLDLARLDQEYISSLLGSVTINTLILEVIATFKKEDQKRIVVETKELNITVLADAERLKKALIQLIDNAIKYSDRIVTISLEKTHSNAYIYVCDQGCGIPVQDQPHIFNPFYRVDPSRSRATGGSGLGLAIAKVLVEGMEGNLNIQSQVGLGSIFKIKLKAVAS
ncbi:histidine kinase [Synechococcus sp. PCC 7502]|uniref:sensor histidine kinase n=1 Tax=Synechococcus sp. PCC 7502 TaxID=1173263 RepID=UPI00029FCD25|nr:ATP-binding protein [Synechococcus sp. PCC 7502]AFY75100.1 histidine kinase [Synechococcus sp. PCC 7502]